MTSPLETEATKLAEVLIAYAKNAINTAQNHTCTACPLCRFLAQLQWEDPDLAEKVAVAIADTTTGVVKLLSILSSVKQASETSKAANSPENGSPGAEQVQLIKVEE